MKQELETERLKLRQWRNQDFDAFATYMATPHLAEFVGGVCSRDLAWRRFASIVGHWTLRGYGFFALEELERGAFVGCCGLWFPEGWPELEVGYWLMPEAQGKGYATEAARRVIAHAFDDLGTQTLVSYIDPRNGPSIKVAERLGARREAEIELSDAGKHLVFRHSCPG